VELRREIKKLLGDHKVEMEELIKENKRLLGEANTEIQELRKQLEAEKSRSVERKRSRSPTTHQVLSVSVCSTSQQGNGCSPAGPTRPTSLSDGIITQTLPGTLPRLTLLDNCHGDLPINFGFTPQFLLAALEEPTSLALALTASQSSALALHPTLPHS
jgi:hypothetical protein